MKQYTNRQEIDSKYKWDIEDMYPGKDQMEEDLKASLQLAKEFASMEGSLTKDSKTLLKALRLHDSLWQKAERAYVYGHMKQDEDNRVEESQAMNSLAQTTIAKLSTLTSFATPELLAAPDGLLLEYVKKEPELAMYRFYIESLLREKDHILSDAEERIMAQFSEVTPATNQIFTMLNNADIDFGKITDEKGNQVELTHGNYIKFMQSQDEVLRKAAYERVYETYKSLINTIATAYSFNTKTDVVTARIRKYESSRAAALHGDNIPLSVYDNLVKAVHDNLPTMYRYMKLRKKLLHVDRLHMYDIYVPLIALPERVIPYEEALDMVRTGLAPLGEEYIANMNKGLASGWIDVYENTGKTSGAYSFGSYDSKPYILLNYTETLQDVFTIVHEMGHSMHSFYTRESQPFVYGSHSIFTAETASTVNENLLMKHLLATETHEEMIKYLINMHIEAFRTTVFRQTMFAEFEQKTHEKLEQGETLTPEGMSQMYADLNKLYFGPDVVTDDLIRYEWARIPHFYNAFYVYKYATGYSAATAISDLILKNGTDNYIDFLRTGNSNYPIELLKIAGVDMSTKEPVDTAMKVFTKLVDQLGQLMG